MRVFRSILSATAAFVSILGLAALCSNRLHAQGATASVTGTVLDTSGAAVPGALIEIRNVGTAAKRDIASDGQGRFVIPDLAIGDYEIQASKMGFQTVLRKGITLDVG